MAQFLETWVFSDLYLDTAFLPQKITSHQQTCQLPVTPTRSWRFGHYHTRLNMLLPIFCLPSSSYFFWSVLSFLPWNLFCFLPLKGKGRKWTKQFSPHLVLAVYSYLGISSIVLSFINKKSIKGHPAANYLSLEFVIQWWTRLTVPLSWLIFLCTCIL